MTPIKMFTFSCDIKVFNLGFGLSLERDDYTLFIIGIGPFSISLNKKQYWKNGII